MIEIPALTAVLVAEGLVAALLVLVFVLWSTSRRRKAERKQAAELVDRINRMDAQRVELLDGSTSPLDESQRRLFREEIDARERALYRLVIRAFLDRDTHRLVQLDQHVHALTEPFRALLAQLAAKLPPQESGDLLIRLESAEQASRQASGEVERLSAQLKAALETLDEVSSEYTRMFGESKNGDEIQLSRHRMLEAFQRAEALARGERPAIGAEEPPP